ncbi:MAG: hypothetical protein NT005_06530 [Spirochaetes bacterium]|nr:hypothetical protein [Spirochaetota bacterium]
MLCVALAPPASAGSLRIGLESWMQGPDMHGFRCELSDAGSRLMLAYQGEGPPGAAAPGRFAFGLCTPWVRMGTLSPAGLIREAANPLGFGPESDVFSEETGFTLDGSVSSPQRVAVLLTPAPGRLGLFYRVGPGGRGQAGCFARTEPGHRLAVEGLAAVAAPAAAAQKEEWFARLSPFPGALVAQSAARLLMDLPGAAASVTLGLSGSERRPPGAFLHAGLRIGDDAASAAFLLGLADGNYTTLSGEGSAEQLSARGTFAIRRPSGAAELRCSLDVGQPRFAPARYLATAGSVGASIERERPLGAVGAVTVRIEAERSVRIEPDGGRADSVDCSASLIARSKSLEVEAGVSTDGSRADARASARWTPARSALGASLDVRLAFGDCAPLLSAETRFRLERECSAITFGAGLEECVLPAADPAGALRFSLGWEVRRPCR